MIKKREKVGENKRMRIQGYITKDKAEVGHSNPFTFFKYIYYH